MKAAISIPDELFDKVERTRKNLGMSRSELFAKAAEQWLSDRDEATLTARINAACAGMDTSLAPELIDAQGDVLAAETW